MKPSAVICALFLFAVCIPDLQAQKFTLGAGSGVNFSDLHNTRTTGYWKPKPGPSACLFFQWSMTPVLGLQTGLDYSTVYYDNKNYSNFPGPIYYPMYHDYMLPEPYITVFPGFQSSSHSFLTLPLQFTVKIFSRPSLTLGGGMFWSTVLDQDWNISGYDEPGPGTDYGYLCSLMIDYPLTERLNLFARTRYLTGRRMFGQGWDYKHGYSDLIAGLSFRLVGSRDEDADGGITDPLVNEDITVSWFAGANHSWNSGNVSNNKYSSYTGPSAGFSIDFRLGGSRTWFSTGLIMERTGYSLRDSSDIYYMYKVTDNPLSEVDTRISSDYAVIPALLDFHFGQNEIFSLSLGPWFAARLNSQCRGIALRETTTASSYQLLEITVNDDITELTRRNDFGLMAGAEVTLPIRGGTRVNLGMHFRQGIPEMLNHENASILPGGAGNRVYIRNSVLTLRAGVTVPVNKAGR